MPTKIFLFYIVFLFLDFQALLTDEREKIIQNLNKVNSIKFNFVQTSNNISENGICFLEFPKKLKCVYFDKNQKVLIINNKTLAISQKRYKKTYYYSNVGSPFEKILDKKKLVSVLKTSKLKVNDKIIKLTSFDSHEQRLSIIFNKKNYSLLGWEAVDKFNNNISFFITIISTNEKIDSKEFKIPTLN
ncbi:MAG: Outer membrane lipoprotein-sorting protein [Pelagibacterales bacterium]|nr:Outer membrane lipoprotein-sorting protein [Pelagibacterales bacterium]